MQLATTLVHKGAIEIAVHAVSSFARHFRDTHILQIHTDGSPDEADHAILLEAAAGMQASIVTPQDRQPHVSAALACYPLSAELLGRGGYFCKLELPIFVSKPFFYFDSDIVWLRPVENFTPPTASTAFSTESWSWYHGVSNDSQWIHERIPRRVNSGFYHLSTEFPHERLERMLKDQLFDPEKPYNTDQEMMAFLYPEMEYYHPEDLKRSRRGVYYDFTAETCAALHFPGKMWETHMEQIKQLPSLPARQPLNLSFLPTVPLDRAELARMRGMLWIAESRFLRLPLKLFRKLRRVVRQ